MKIVYLAHQFYPSRCYGAGHFVYNLARTAFHIGHEVNVVTRHPVVNRWESILRRLKIGLQARRYIYDQLQVTSFYNVRMPRIGTEALYDVDIVNAAVNFLKKLNPDVLHAGHLMGTIEFFLAAERLGIPRIISLPDYWPICPKIQLITSSGDNCSGPHQAAACRMNCPEQSSKWIKYRLMLMRRILQSAEKVTAPSLYLQQIMQAEFQGEIGVDLIEHGVQKENFPLRPLSEFGKLPLTFLYSGALVPHKGVQVLIEAFRQVPGDHIRLLIYGSGSYETHLKKLAANDRRIFFGGFYSHEQAGTILRQAEVVIVPSIWAENCPLVVLEAQASGIPVIASDIGNLPNMIADGINGALFPPGNIASLANLLKSLIADPYIILDWGKNLHARPSRSADDEFADYLLVYSQGDQNAHA